MDIILSVQNVTDEKLKSVYRALNKHFKGGFSLSKISLPQEGMDAVQLLRNVELWRNLNTGITAINNIVWCIRVAWSMAYRDEIQKENPDIEKQNFEILIQEKTGYSVDTLRTYKRLLEFIAQYPRVIVSDIPLTTIIPHITKLRKYITEKLPLVDRIRWEGRIISAKGKPSMDKRLSFLLPAIKLDINIIREKYFDRPASLLDIDLPPRKKQKTTQQKDVIEIPAVGEGEESEEDINEIGTPSQDENADEAEIEKEKENNQDSATGVTSLANHIARL